MVLLMVLIMKFLLWYSFSNCKKGSVMSDFTRFLLNRTLARLRGTYSVPSTNGNCNDCTVDRLGTPICS